MDPKTKKNKSPYSSMSFYETTEWFLVKNALKDLVNNKDLIINTEIDYVVGYLMKSLKEGDKYKH